MGKQFWFCIVGQFTILGNGQMSGVGFCQWAELLTRATRRIIAQRWCYMNKYGLFDSLSGRLSYVSIENLMATSASYSTFMLFLHSLIAFIFLVHTLRTWTSEDDFKSTVSKKGDKSEDLHSSITNNLMAQESCNKQVCRENGVKKSEKNSKSN